MPTIEEVIAANRARVLGRTEGPMLRALLIDYSRVRARVERQVIELAAAIARQGGQPTISQILHERRYKVLEAQLDNQLRILTRREAVRIEAVSAVAVDAGVSDALAMAASVAASESSLVVPATERIVGALQRGSALNALVNELPVQARYAVQNALVDGIIRGLNPRVTARAVSGALGGQTARALTIARTETMRAYRGAQLEVYKANPDVVQGWIWISGRDRRTCAMCWAMHGSEHELDEIFASHPSCRCNPGPTVLGPDRPRVRAGREQFAELSTRDQLHILGPAKYRAYRDGALDLPDLVYLRNDPRWGPVRGERSLTGVLGHDRAMAYRVPGRAVPAAPVPPPPPAHVPRFDVATQNRAIDAWVEEGFTIDNRGVEDAVLSRATPQPELWRGLGMTQDQITLMRSGELADLRLSSFSFNRDVADTFAPMGMGATGYIPPWAEGEGVRLPVVIRLRPGAPGLAVRDALPDYPTSQYAWQEEVIVQGQFRVVAQETQHVRRAAKYDFDFGPLNFDATVITLEPL